MVASADGDGRFLLNQVETLYDVELDQPLDPAGMAALLHRRVPVYDKDREGHYNLISALHKTIRGSDPQAALYYLARMLVAGEEPLYVLRRLTRAAIEDIGLADPQALVQCLAAKDAYDFLGSPEGELAIVQACLYLATAPKSNAAYMAQKSAYRSAKDTGSLMPPTHILNAPTQLMKDIGYGKGYAYDHDADEGFSGAGLLARGNGRADLLRAERPRPRSPHRRTHRLLERASREAQERRITEGDDVPDRSAGGLLARPVDPVGTQAPVRGDHPCCHALRRQGGAMGGGEKRSTACPVLKRHPQAGVDSVGTELGRLFYWLVWLVGLVAALQPLGLSGVLTPVTGMTNEIFAFLPKLLGAGVFFFAGLILARELSAMSSRPRLARSIIERLLGRAGISIGEAPLAVDQSGKTSEGVAPARNSIARAIGVIVSAIIIIFAAIGHFRSCRSPPSSILRRAC